MPVTVSIIVPTYNQKDLLTECIRALKGQDFPAEKYENIIIDDGSTDGTEELLKGMAQKVNLRYFSQENSGPASARNFGISKAEGTIIAFTDTDCVPGKDWLKSALPYFDDKKVAGVEGKTIVKNPEGNTPFSHYAENRNGNGYLTCNIFYRKGVLEEAGGFDDRFKQAIREDSDLAFTIIEKGMSIKFAPEAVVEHTVTKTDYSRHFKKAREGLYDALLFKKHPRLYRKKLKWYDGWAFPVYYYGYYLAPVLIFVSLLVSSNLLLPAAALSFIFSHFITITLACRKKRTNVKYLSILFFQFLIIPFIRFYWVMKGNIRFRTFVW